MSETSEYLWCENCGVEITWGAYLVKGRIYCCEDCFNGIPCDCDERMATFEDDRRPGQALAPG